MDSATVGVSARSWRSLQGRLTVLITGCCIAALSLVLLFAYLEVDSTLEAAASERANHAAGQVAQMFAQSAQQVLEQARRTTPALTSFLENPTPENLAGARAALAQLHRDETRRITLWNAVGELVLDVPPGAATTGAASELRPPASLPALGIGAMSAVGRHAVTDAAVPIESGGADRQRLGTLGVRSILSITPPDALNRLVGADARVLFGNKAGDVWTDSTQLAAAPPVHIAGGTGHRYRDADGTDHIGALAALPGTPWVAWVDFPVGDARAYDFARRMAMLALGLALATALVAAWFGGRVALPLQQLQSAAAAVAGGDYSRRIASVGSSEIDRLAEAFNAMSADVAGAQQQLEHQVAERTAELKTALAALDHRSRDRESYLATIVDNSADAIIGKDLDGRVTSWNRGAEQIFGYAAAEVIGRPILFLIPVDRHPEEAMILHTIRRGGTVAHFETVRLAKDGRALDVSLTISPIRDAAGNVIGVSKVARDVTAEKQAENRLVERERQLSLYARHSPVAVAMFDRDMRYLVASTRWIEDFNLGDTEIIGRCHYDIFGDLPDHWKAVHRRCLAGAIEKQDEERFVRADGAVSWLRWEVRPWRQADDTVGGLLIFSEDISARKLAESQMHESEARYRTLFDYAPDGILIADAESYYLDANPAMCSMLGYRDKELIGLHASDIVSPPELPHIAEALESITAKRDYHREWIFRRRDGSTFLADVIATEMPDGRLLGMVRDVTERNLANEAVRTAEERMRFALESTEVGIWSADYRTGVVEWSPILERQYGLAAGTFAGTFDAFLAAVHADDRLNVRRVLDDAARSGQDFSMQHRVVRPGGDVRWVNGVGRVYLDANGEPLRATGISIDVTDRRQLEAQFQQAQKMEAIGRLAGGVAHDFNNLLTVILGNCELAGAGLVDSRTLRHLIGIETAAHQAAGLTRQLLAFSRKQLIEPTLVDLNAVVGDLRKMLGRLIGEDIRVVVDLPDGLGLVVADRNQIEQVVMNLAVNARDAMPRGGTLTIQTANVELDAQYAASHFGAEPGPHVVLTCSDTGTGMSAEVQARLFEPFFTTKEMGKGTGLGLATVHGIVARSGGSIGVYSELGRGSTFKVYFPRAGDVPVVAAPVVTEVTAAGGGETVLVVEDADLLRSVAKELLQRAGYTVLTAENAVAAATVFDHHPEIAVLLTDVVMPGASGPELTEQLIARRPELKVIFMSGYTEEAIVHHGVSTAGHAFLHKPFTSETLSRAVRNALTS